ncbi:lymphocyte antigen 6E-like [Tiliqua scincoides]|uniref:lymphocyte antigen 6E-like n=1 Tax=Tiliqua scincoides TaxID=71010 RepID=UPI003461C55D
MPTGAVHPLVCFTCDKQSSNWGCLKVTKCSDKDKHCLTSVASWGIGSLVVGKRITKKCSPTCPDWNLNLGLASFTTSCCQSFLCNLFEHKPPKNATQ